MPRNLKRKMTVLDNFLSTPSPTSCSPFVTSNGPLNSFVQCPNCVSLIHMLSINSHLDHCAIEKENPPNPAFRSALHDFQWAALPDAPPVSPADTKLLTYTPPGQEMPPFLRSFHAMAVCGLQLYPSHCSIEERAWAAFLTMPIHARMFYARLFRRKNSGRSRWFKLNDALVQAAVRDSILPDQATELHLQQVAAELVKAGLARTTTAKMECEELVNVAHGLLSSLRLDQLTSVLCMTLPKSQAEARRIGRLANLKILTNCLVPKGGLSFCALKTSFVTSSQTRLARRIFEAVGPCIQLQADYAMAFNKLSLAFHLGQSPDDVPSVLFAASLPDTNNQRICRVSRYLFENRQALVYFEEAKRKEAELQTLSDGGDLCGILAMADLSANQLTEGESPARPAPFGLDYLSVCAGILWHSVSVLEKSGKHDRAVEFLLLLLSKPFTPKRRGKWYNRLTIDLDHLGRRPEAIEHCLLGLSETERRLGMRRGDRFQLAKRAVRLSNHSESQDQTRHTVSSLLGNDDMAEEIPTHSLFGRPIDKHRAQGAQSLFYGYNDEKVSVEDLCIQHYMKRGWKGRHCEGRMLRHLFLLLCHDQIFADIVDSFHVPYQNLPLDLGGPDFLAKRKHLLKPRLESLKTAKYEELFEWTVSALVKHGGDVGVLEALGHSGFSKAEAEEHELAEIAGAVGGQCLATVFLLFSLDFSYYGSGLPDLLLWRLKPSPEARFVEVKGPRDTLSERQRGWLHEFLAVNQKCGEICRVLEPDEKKSLQVEDPNFDD